MAIRMPWRMTTCGQRLKETATGSKDRDLGRVPLARPEPARSGPADQA
jgi:hypothetical protein